MATATKPKPRKAKAAKTERLLLVFVLDRSGSMASCARSTVEGFNTFLHDQLDEHAAGEPYMTLVQFGSDSQDPVCQVRYDGVALREVAELGTPANPYLPRGGTPLYDAVGQTIRRAEAVADQYDHVQFVIQTDGQENSSTDWNQRTLYELVGAKRAAGWDFIFMGANIDAYAASSTLNVSPLRSISYDSSHQSHKAFASMSSAVLGNRQSSYAAAVMDSAIPELENAPVARPDDAAPVQTSTNPPTPSKEDPGWLR